MRLDETTKAVSVNKNGKRSKDWFGGTSRGAWEGEVSVVGGKLGTRRVQCPESKVLKASEGER